MIIRKIKSWIDNTFYDSLRTDGAESDLLFVLVLKLLTSAEENNGSFDANLWVTINDCYRKYHDAFQSRSDQINLGYTQTIKFGTAGVRNTLTNGAGGINVPNIIRLTNAVVKNYKSKFSRSVLSKGKVLVLGDSRMQSNKFVHLVTAILSHNGISVVISPFNLPTPTPFASYAIKKNKYLGGIVITASHNNYCDNGYKVYNKEGMQINSSDSLKISKYFASERTKKVNCNLEPIDIDYFSFISENDYFNYGEKFVQIIAKKFNFNFTKKKRAIKITYSSQFGASHMFIPRTLRNLGYQINLVKNQSFFDSEFHGLEFTMNPENFNAYQESIKQATRTRSNIILHTDCDGDRIGVCLYSQKRQQWEYVHTTKIAILIILFLHELGQISLIGKHLVTSYVSGSLIVEIAEKLKMIVQQTPTGPKNLVEAMLNQCNKKCLFAFEQSNGFIFSEQIPDKDGLTSSVMIATMLEHFKHQGLDYDGLTTKVGEKYGYLAFHEDAKWLKNSYTDETVAKIFTAIIDKNVPEFSEFGNFSIHNFAEINTNTKANFYQVKYTKHNWIILRLSNTERKLKFYVHWVTTKYLKSEEKALKLVAAAHQFVNRILDKNDS